MKKEEIMFLVKEFMDTQTAMEVRDVLDRVLKKETETMVNLEAKAQRQEPVDPMLFNIYHQQLRAKALELAIASCGDRVESMADYVILSIAKHFYTYITKGE